MTGHVASLSSQQGVRLGDPPPESVKTMEQRVLELERFVAQLIAGGAVPNLSADANGKTIVTGATLQTADSGYRVKIAENGALQVQSDEVFPMGIVGFMSPDPTDTAWIGGADGKVLLEAPDGIWDTVPAGNPAPGTVMVATGDRWHLVRKTDAIALAADVAVNGGGWQNVPGLAATFSPLSGDLRVGDIVRARAALRFDTNDSTNWAMSIRWFNGTTEVQRNSITGLVDNGSGLITADFEIDGDSESWSQLNVKVGRYGSNGTAHAGSSPEITSWLDVELIR